METKNLRRPISLNADFIIQLPLSLSLFQSARFIDIDACPLGFNLSDWPGKPFSRPEKPATECPEGNDAYSNGRVVQCLGVDWIQFWKAEDDGQEHNIG